jgi:hypothetical protein
LDGSLDKSVFLEHVCSQDVPHCLALKGMTLSTDIISSHLAGEGYFTLLE